MNRVERYLTGLTDKQLIEMKHADEAIRLQLIECHENYDAVKSLMLGIIFVLGIVLAFFIGG
jgi:hypothetical protein